MKSAWMFVAAALAVAACSAPAQATPADGELLSTSPCAPATAASYDGYIADAVKAYQDEADLAAKAHAPAPRPASELPAALLTREEFAQRQASPSDCRHVFYSSDGLKVRAFIWEPHGAAPGAKLPVVLALRGGNGTFGELGPRSQQGMWAFTQAGFVVIGVQYRGADGGEGQDEYGGADIDDVLNAIALARRLPEADADNLFIYGTSRGGMQTLLALARGAPARAAVLVSPFTDLELEARERPELATQTWPKVIPGFAVNPAARLAERSGVRVAAHADLPPILLLHGTTDWRADPKNSVEVADALKARGRPYELRLFDGDVHGLTWSWREREQLSIAWFRAHLKP
jgi:dipeptidyl aminopeptidase/acylaminoacyl peptidase